VAVRAQKQTQLVENEDKENRIRTWKRVMSKRITRGINWMDLICPAKFIVS
jgi:hypothetical protein